MVSHRIYICDYTLIFHLCQALIPNNLGLTIQDRYSIIKHMNKTTNRNIKKEAQLKHIKEKLHALKNRKSKKKNNLVKTLKNLMKRNDRKGL